MAIKSARVELVPFPVVSPDVPNRFRPRPGIRFAGVVAFLFFLDDAADELFQLFGARAAAHLGVEVVVPHREQAGADFAVAGDADAATVAAEGMRDGRDDADFADAVVETVAARGFGARVRDFNQRAVLGHAGQNFVERDHGVRRPGAAFFERHELDQAHRHAFFARELSKWDDLILIEATHQHAVYFQRP